MKLRYVPVGRIVNTHGVRGEVRALPVEKDPA
ncbi:MAG: 16S rRNA processing protein RimM, partial [Oscillibacter sp.]|nr:16S rRNA processing protein RimM [Oscillibacter sp.]